jgi:hypothetical protein
MQRQMLVKVRKAEEAFESRLLHPGCVSETHVVGNQRQDLLRLVIGKSETAADLSSNLHPHLHMPVKTYTVRRSTKSGRFAYVVQQGSPRQGHRAASTKPVEQ